MDKMRGSVDSRRKVCIDLSIMLCVCACAHARACSVANINKHIILGFLISRRTALALCTCTMNECVDVCFSMRVCVFVLLFVI